jgi:hypothetical protein
MADEDDDATLATWVTRKQAVTGIALPRGGIVRLRLFDLRAQRRVDTPTMNVVHGVVADAAGNPAAGLNIAVKLADGRTQIASTDAAGNFAVNTGALDDNVDISLA